MDDIRDAAQQPWDDDETPTVLFVCVHNAGRSQLAAAYTRALSHGRVAAVSAGTTPADRIHPEVVAALAEDHLDVSGVRPRHLDEELVDRAHVIITMGCDDDSPSLAGRRTLEWRLPDPAGRPLGEVRAIRDEVKDKVRWLLAEFGPLDGEVEPEDN